MIDECWSAGAYSAWLRDAVLGYKSGRIEYKSGLVEVLAQVLQVSGARPDCLVNIPSTAEKVRSRGFDTVGELCAQLANLVTAQHKPVLIFRRKVQDQVGLNRNARAENLGAAFSATSLISGTVVLVDDVVTTGATVTAAAKTLRLCGAKKIFVISLCRT